MTQLKPLDPATIVRLLRQTLSSDTYAARLEKIHKHYHNSKNEGRYRDALLEEFNAAPEAKMHRLEAYSEADKVDMVVTRPEMRRDGWVKIELKYQFAYDFASRVRGTLEQLKKDAPKQTVVEQLDALPKNDLKRIVTDCLRKEPDSDAWRCDVFVVIVQDRYGARHPDASPPACLPGKKKPWACPELDTRGVRLQFLHEQLSLDARHTAASSYDEAWMIPAWETLKLICGLRPFNLEIAAHKMTDGAGPFPLTSYLFTLDFTESGLLPASAGDFVKVCKSAAGL